MNPEATFNQLGVDAIVGTSLLEWLNMAPEEVNLPERFMRLQSIIKFLKPFPTDTQRYLIRKVTVGKPVDRLNQVFEYTGLLQQRTAHEEALMLIGKEKVLVTEEGEEIEKIRSREKDVKKQLKMTEEEIRLYEK